MLGADQLTKLVESSVKLIEEENSDLVQVRSAMLIVETHGEHGETAFYTFCTDKREWIQKAMIREADEAIELSQMGAVGDE